MLTVFETILNSREKNLKQGRWLVHSGGIWNEFELQRQFWKQGRWMLHSDGIWNDFELQINLKKQKQGRQMMISDGIWNDL